MRTISIRIDEPLLGRLDDVARSAGKTRSDLLHLALQEWLDRTRRQRLAAEERAAYEKHPVQPDEFEGLIASEADLLPDPPESDPGDDW